MHEETSFYCVFVIERIHYERVVSFFVLTEADLSSYNLNTYIFGNITHPCI